MRLFSIKGFIAQRRAIKQALAQSLPPVRPEDAKVVEFICAHYTVMGLSFFIKFKDGTTLQKKVNPSTVNAVAEMFAAIEV